MGKLRPKQNATENTRKKGTKTQNIATSKELRGDSPSGLAMNAPFSLGFEFTFLSEFNEFVSRVLVYVKHPPKCQIYF